jgi:long-chain acyl-CoA synthetase
LPRWNRWPRTDRTTPAIVFGDETLSYARLMSRVLDAALHLRSLGLGQGSVFAAYSPNRPELVLCYYAAARIGAVFVPVNPNLTPAEVAYTFRHSGAELLLCDASVAEIAAAAVPDGQVIPLDVLRSPPPVIDPQPPADVRPEDPFLVIYTSGTTGTPKAIVLDHAAQTAAPRALAEMWGVTDRDITLVALPLGYLYGLSTGAAAGLQSGGTVVILRVFTRATCLRLLSPIASPSITACRRCSR